MVARVRLRDPSSVCRNHWESMISWKWRWGRRRESSSHVYSPDGLAWRWTRSSPLFLYKKIEKKWDCWQWGSVAWQRRPRTQKPVLCPPNETNYHILLIESFRVFYAAFEAQGNMLARRYNEKMMNAIWGLYNRNSAHNFKSNVDGGEVAQAAAAPAASV